MEHDVKRLRGLLWFAYHEFNAIRARSGAPLDQYGMTLCAESYWDELTDTFERAIGPDARTPWPSEEAKGIILRANQKDQKND